MAGHHHQCNEHELGQTPGDGEGQGCLLCCCPWGHKESDTAGQLSNNNQQIKYVKSKKFFPRFQGSFCLCSNILKPTNFELFIFTLVTYIIK